MAIPNTFTNGTVADADEVNANFTYVNTKIKQIYTGNGFDSLISSNGTDEQDHELTAEGSTTANYVKVRITGTASIGLSTYSYIELKAQIKETGGDYADIISYKKILSGNMTDTYGHVAITSTYETIATLTAGQKTNGYQIKVFSKSTAGSGIAASFVNSQTVIGEVN